jgi:asparagine synthase (glutamine-hydrolysing)
MCGIAGVYYFDGQIPQEAPLRRAGNALRHRGPDDGGFFVHESCGMVHRRLSIIDLTTGRQPVFNEDKSVCTILNGEIYNYRELRANLEANGHTFSTSSDTEVLVHLYEESRSLDFLAQVNGMFAFAIYDQRNRSLWLARDRSGKKPLYYYTDGRQLAFASELQALLELPGLQLDISEQAVDAFLRYNYVPSPLSIYRQVLKLPAAHVLKVERGNIGLQRYWRMPPPHPDRMLSDDDFQEAFTTRLSAAVGSRLLSDVPLGAFLSGGLDSTAIVLLLCDRLGSAVSTFSVGFDSGSFDESAEALEVASALGTDHHLEVQRSISVSDIDRILDHFGEPFGDSSAIPTYYLCRMARQHVTVALSGDGADEVLGGYNRYVAGQIAEQWARLPRPLRLRRALRWVEALPESTGYYGESLTKKIKLLSRFIGRLEDQPADVMPIVIDDLARSALYSDRFREAVAVADGGDPVLEVSRRFAGLNLTQRMLWTDFDTYLADDIHVKVDRMSMAHSLEVRCPFLDVHLLEFLATVPLHFKIQGNHTKRMLREFVAKRLPAAARRPKHGFEAPIGEWINGELRERVDDLFAGSQAGHYFDRARLRALVDAHRVGRQDMAKPIWAAFVLLRWAESQRSRGAAVLS